VTINIAQKGFGFVVNLKTVA